MRCEHLADPLGIDEPRPLLSWTVEGGVQPARTEVLVGSDGQQLANRTPDIWQRAVPGTTTSIAYDGPPLRSRQRCSWTVRTTDADGGVHLSSPAHFEMGLLDPDDWHAAWVGLPWSQPLRDHRPCPRLRREFELTRRAGSARLYASALGAYRLWINGREVAPDRLEPGWTDYGHRVPYRTYDIGALLESGRNVLAASLGEAWYCGRVGFHDQRDRYGTRPHLRLQLEVDGGVPRIVTDGTWRASFGEHLRSDLLLGEIQDHRLATPGWTAPGFDDASWEPVTVDDPDVGPMTAAAKPPVRVVQEIAPVSVDRPWPGVQVVDLGQNLAGWVRLEVDGPAGAEVIVRHAEVLDAAGCLYRGNLRRADATDHYILAGGPAVLEPSFTSHGFRYVEIEAPEDVEILDITGCVAHSDLEPAGRFVCSDPLVQRIRENIVWSQRSNATGYPTDCPQRDERLAWTGDAVAIAPTAMFNLDLAAWYADWLTEIRAAQGDDGSFPDVAPLADSPANRLHEGAPGWGDAGVTLAWDHYVWYGDRRMIELSYPAARRWVDLIASRNPDGLWRDRRGHDYGDWLAFVPTPKEMLATAFLHRSASTLARMACVLGDADGVDRYGRLADHVRGAFIETYVSPEGHVHGDTQTAYAVALRFGLVPTELRTAAGDHLADAVEHHGGPTTGYLGTPHLLPALTDVGRVELAYELIRSEDLPSWGYQVRHGATTIWERWDGWTEERGFHEQWMNSFNHVTLGAVGQWLHETVGGIAPDPEAPGFRHIRIAPRPGGGLTSASASLETVRGRVAVGWERDGDRWELEVTVPAVSAATVSLPAASAPLAVPDRATQPTDTEHLFQVPGGTHRFAVGRGVR